STNAKVGASLGGTGGTTWTPPSRREWTIDSNRSACIGLARRDSRSFATQRGPFPRGRTEATNPGPGDAPKRKSAVGRVQRAQPAEIRSKGGARSCRGGGGRIGWNGGVITKPAVPESYAAMIARYADGSRSRSQTRV